MLTLPANNYFDFTVYQCETDVIPFGVNSDYNFAVGIEYNFSPNSVINSKTIVGLQVVTNTEQRTFTVNNITRDMLTPTQLSGGLIYMRDKNNKDIMTVPLTSLTRPANNGKFLETNIKNHWWQNCFVVFTANPGGIGNTTGLKFNVFLK